jgi:hypothetical protein
MLRGIRSTNSLKEATANFKSSGHVQGSGASAAQDSNASLSQAKLIQQRSMRNVLAGNFTKSLIKDDDNSVNELYSLSNQKINAYHQNLQDPRYLTVDSKGNSKDSRNQVSKTSLSS